jgi:uncharacterized membrane protein (Fun14 family)
MLCRQESEIRVKDGQDNAAGSGGPGRWVAWLVAAAAAVTIVGVGLHMGQVSPDSGTGDGATYEPGTEGEDSAARGILPRQDPSGQAQEPDEQPSREANPYWPALARVGLGFLLGFCVAYTLKTFLKLTLLLSSLAILLLVGLGQTGAVDLDFAALEPWLEKGWEIARQQFDSIRAFITGLIPTSGSAIAGVILGILKR